MVDSRIFGILLKSSLAMIPKHDLILMCFSPIKKICKNNGGQQAIVSKVRKQLNVTRFFRLREIPDSA
jgi:hypothetical protein